MFSNSLDPDSGVFQIRNQIFGRIRVRIQRIWIRNTALHSPLCLGCDGLPGGDHVEPVQQQGDGLRHDAGPVPRDQQEAAGRPGGHPPQEYHTQGNQNRLITVHLPHRILIWPHMRPKKVHGNPQIFSSHSILTLGFRKYGKQPLFVCFSTGKNANSIAEPEPKLFRGSRTGAIISAPAPRLRSLNYLF